MENPHPVKQVILRGKRYSITRVSRLDISGKFEGDCSPPSEPNRRIRVLNKMKGEPELDVLIHEMLHGCLWDIDEGVITETASDIAHALWRMGYRKSKD